MIRLDANPDLGEVKYIRFQYNCHRTGQFKTIELISSLPLSAERIIQSHAWRWVATETEFRILQHQFGLEKVYIKKPEKAWPLILLVLCSKMIMEMTFRGYSYASWLKRVHQAAENADCIISSRIYEISSCCFIARGGKSSGVN